MCPINSRCSGRCSFCQKVCFNVAELKQFCKEGWTEINPWQCARRWEMMYSYHKRLIALVGASNSTFFLVRVKSFKTVLCLSHSLVWRGKRANHFPQHVNYCQNFSTRSYSLLVVFKTHGSDWSLFLNKKRYRKLSVRRHAEWSGSVQASSLHPILLYILI